MYIIYIMGSFNDDDPAAGSLFELLFGGCVQDEGSLHLYVDIYIQFYIVYARQGVAAFARSVCVMCEKEGRTTRLKVYTYM